MYLNCFTWKNYHIQIFYDDLQPSARNYAIYNSWHLVIHMQFVICDLKSCETANKVNLAEMFYDGNTGLSVILKYTILISTGAQELSCI